MASPSISLQRDENAAVAALVRQILRLVWRESMPIAPDLRPDSDGGLIDRIYREEWGRIVATLIRLLGSFELAEEAAQEAFAIAVEQWPRGRAPANPRAWLVSTARHKAIDALRRRSRWEYPGDPDEVVAKLERWPAFDAEEDLLEDDRLRLIFTCCHPAIALEAQVALTLRTLCGLTTEQIARGFLVPASTMAQRLVRAQRKIGDAGIPYRIPAREELAERLAAVLLVVYLVFNEGYNAASDGSALSDEAIRLGRLLVELMPREAEARGLLALMLLHDARRETRRSSDGDPILLEEQDRSRWDAAKIREGAALAQSALRDGPGPYSVQAAIAAVHAEAAHAEHTDWPQIVRLYDVLMRMQPSPVIELNRAAAVAMAEGCEAGLRLIEAIAGQGSLDGYFLLPAARADMLRRLGRWDAALDAYRAALQLAAQESDRRFLLKRIAEIEASAV